MIRLFLVVSIAVSIAWWTTPTSAASAQDQVSEQDTIGLGSTIKTSISSRGRAAELPLKRGASEHLNLTVGRHAEGTVDARLGLLSSRAFKVLIRDVGSKMVFRRLAQIIVALQG